MAPRRRGRLRPKNIPPRIARPNQLANGLQKEQADRTWDSLPFTREEIEAYVDGVRRAINGLWWAAPALQQVSRRPTEIWGNIAPSIGYNDPVGTAG